MKRDRYGKAKVLTQAEIEVLFSDGLLRSRDRALFGFCLYTACRVNEACTQLTEDVYNPLGRVRPEMIIRKCHAKGQLSSRVIPTSTDLEILLKQHSSEAGDYYLFPGRWGRGHIHPDSAALIFREACKRVKIEGASTHSFRRTALTQMSDNGVPLRIIQEISGHRNLEQLQKYLEVRDAQVKGAIASLSRLSYAGTPKFLDETEPQSISDQLR